MNNDRFGARNIARGGAGAVAGRVLLGIAALGAVIVFVRSLPDLVRYLRIRRM